MADRRPVPDSRPARDRKVPSAGRAAPVPETPAFQAELRRILLAGWHCLARKIKRDELLEEPVTVGPDHVEPRPMSRRKPSAFDHPPRRTWRRLPELAHQWVAQR